jgi:ABC-type molybdenum transport system ATPase subunit/photorepair protein PhrA
MQAAPKADPCASSARPTTLARLKGYTGGATLLLEGVSVGVADNCLIKGLTWAIMPHERWAIVGPNGCGKSTLLKALTGTLPELIMAGKITSMGGVRLGYLEQTAVSVGGGGYRGAPVSLMAKLPR